MLRTLANLQHTDLGYSTEHILTFDFELDGSAYAQPAQKASLIERGLESLAALPGVKKASVVNPLPMRGGNQSTYFVEGTPVPRAGESPSAERIQVNGDYFATLGIPVLAGRSFDAQDAASSARTAIVDTMFVNKHFPGQNPLGRRFAYGEKPPARDSDWLQIVGVVGHIRNFGPRGSTREQTYLPVTQAVPTGGSFVLRAERAPTLLIPAVRASLRTVAGDLPLFNFRTMDDQFTSSVTTERLTLLLLGLFASLALLLAAVGLYGVLSYYANRRSRELGIRMALGATPCSVALLVVRNGLSCAGGGLLLGLLAALGLTRFLRNMLYEVSPFDPASFVVVAVALVAIGLLACWLPAWRAAKTHPMEALRQE